MAYENNVGVAFDWNDEIENESGQYIILPEGDYNFVVTRFERGQHNGSSKVPACKKAIVYLSVNAPEGEAIIKKEFLLHSYVEGILCAFFTCIGQRKPGERFRMDWTKVVGSCGRAHIAPRRYEGKDFNEVKRWLEPAAGQQPAQRQPYAPQHQYQQPQQPQNQPQYQQQTMGGYTPGKF